MSGRGNVRDLDYVESIVRRHPGLPGALIAYMVFGGDVGPDGPADIQHYKRFLKGVSAQKRLHDLEKRGKIKRGRPRVLLDTADTGFYPLGWHSEERGQDRVGGSKQCDDERDSAESKRRGIALLKQSLT